MKNNMKQGNFSLSIDEDRYEGSFETREEAIAEGMTLINEGDSLWTGSIYIPHRVIDAQEIIECVAINTTDEAGEWAEDYLLDVSKEAIKELQEKMQKVWDQWEDKHRLAPNWFNIENAEKHEKPYSKESEIQFENIIDTSNPEKAIKAMEAWVGLDKEVKNK